MRELTRTYATWQIAVKKLVGCDKNEDEKWWFRLNK
jgi:hypothetical protein